MLGIIDQDSVDTTPRHNVADPSNASSNQQQLAAASVENAVKWLAAALIVQILFGIGCSVDFDSFVDRVRRPSGAIVAAFIHFILIPLSAVGFIKLLPLPIGAVLAILVTVSIPSGQIAIALSYFVSGDVKLSGWIAVGSTLLASAATPFNLYVFVADWLIDSFPTNFVIPFRSLLLGSLLMLVPLGIGLLIAKLNLGATEKASKLVHLFLWLTLIGFVVVSAVALKEELFEFAFDQIGIICGVLPLIGFIFGFVLATLLRHDSITRRSMAVEAMTQNGPLASAVLVLLFPSNTIGVYFLLPLVYSAIQFFLSLIFVAIVRYKIKAEQNEKENAFYALGGVPVGRIRRISMHTIDRIRRSFTWSRSSADISEPSPEVNDDEDHDVFTTLNRRHNVIQTAIAEEDEGSSSSHTKNNLKRRESRRSSTPKDEDSSCSPSKFEDVDITKSDS